MQQVFKKFLKNFGYFLFVVPLEIFIHYPDIDISHWLREDVHWMMNKVFRENLRV